MWEKLLQRDMRFFFLYYLICILSCTLHAYSFTLIHTHTTYDEEEKLLIYGSSFSFFSRGKSPSFRSSSQMIGMTNISYFTSFFSWKIFFFLSLCRSQRRFFIPLRMQGSKVYGKEGRWKKIFFLLLSLLLLSSSHLLRCRCSFLFLLHCVTSSFLLDERGITEEKEAASAPCMWDE